MKLVAAMMIVSCLCPMISCTYVVGGGHRSEPVDEPESSTYADASVAPNDVVEVGSASNSQVCCQVAPSDGGCQTDPLWGCVDPCPTPDADYVPWLCKADIEGSTVVACNECSVGEWCQSVSGIGIVVWCPDE